jgi:hypothetical protein
MPDSVDRRVLVGGGLLAAALAGCGSASTGGGSGASFGGGGGSTKGSPRQVGVQGGPLPPAVSAVNHGDATILNVALTLEYLQSAFYAEAVKAGRLTGEAARFARAAAGHEAAHVAAVQRLIQAGGGKPAPAPRFDFKGATSDAGRFARTALQLENVGVAAYLGQAASIRSDKVLKEAAAILAVESRHAAWIADIVAGGRGSSPSPNAFQPSITPTQAIAAARKFIVA